MRISSIAEVWKKICLSNYEHELIFKDFSDESVEQRSYSLSICRTCVNIDETRALKTTSICSSILSSRSMWMKEKSITTFSIESWLRWERRPKRAVERELRKKKWEKSSATGNYTDSMIEQQLSEIARECAILKEETSRNAPNPLGLVKAFGTASIPENATGFSSQKGMKSNQRSIEKKRDSWVQFFDLLILMSEIPRRINPSSDILIASSTSLSSCYSFLS